ncbi:hypothetical protein [Burkholderia stagnalis]|uniref:hypothetical protein n=2 Tax=Burkholderia stagnalis TaxID=1503054 RepID=UPI0012DA430D|nr:hypothetical protein [Burkholderia stagnalis]
MRPDHSRQRHGIEEQCMTSVNRPSTHATSQPKPTWGPGKNAALSLVAFAVIFGLFAYLERDARDERGSATHEASGVVARSIGKAEKYAAAASIRPDLVSTGTVAVAASTPAMRSPVTVQIEPEAAPRSESRASAAPAAPAAPATPAVHAAPAAPPLPAPPVVAANRAPAAHAAPAAGPVKGRMADAHRAHPHPRAHEVANARKHVTVASKPHASGAGAARMQTASVTHRELDGARALARARLCAQLDDWGCVEQNASRALAIDPQNSESRALLERAVRNRS